MQDARGDGANPPRVLVVRVGAMGDVLHALSAVAALRRARPDWEIGWAVDPRWAPLLLSASQPEAQRGSEAMPLVDRIHLVPTREWSGAPASLATLRSIRNLRRELRAEKYDLCIDLQGSIRSAIIGRMAGAKRFVGPSRPREAPARWLYQERVAAQRAHVVEQACEIVGAAMHQALSPAAPPLPIDAEAEAWCAARIDALREQTGAGEFIVLAPGAGWGAKRWPAECFGAVAAQFAAKGCAVLVNCGPDEDDLARQVVRAAHAHPDVAEGNPGADEVAQKIQEVPCGIGQLTSLLRRARLFIGGDTGPLHLAAALQCPVVGIYGPTDPARNGPFEFAREERAVVLRDDASSTDHARRDAPEAGLLRIAPQQVVDAAAALLKESRLADATLARRNFQDGEL